jgi:hypothetical protein
VRTLKLAKDLSFPLDAVTQTFLVVGKRGSGKSNTAARFVEQLHHAHIPFVVLDPVDTWWGLKAGRKGGRGLDVYVFGGRKADLPLEAGGGALIADVLCEHRMSMVLSVKHLSGRERSGFMVAFAQTLFQKWGGGPLHVVLEEAHEFAPQMTSSRQTTTDGESAMLGAFKRLWKLGRSSGIGGTAVTQRPASLSKDITTQSEILIAHRTIGPQDVKAIGEWVKYHGERLDILAELPSLPTGEAFVWAPEFPEGKPIGLQRTVILLRETYDSASTPKVGEQRVEPKELAAVDLERLRVKMAATIEKAKADDPRELRKQIADLKKALAAKHPPAPAAAKEKRVEVLTDADRAFLAALDGRLSDTMDAIAERADLMLNSIAERAKAEIERSASGWLAQTAKSREAFVTMVDGARFQKILDKLSAVTPPTPHNPPTMSAARPSPHGRPVVPRETTARRTPVVPASSNGQGAALAKMHRAMLTALAQHPDGLTKKQILVHTGYASSGPVSTAFANLAREGWVAADGYRLRLTIPGHAALGDYEPLPVGDELRAWLLSGDKLSGMEKALLAQICDAYPEAIRKGDVLEKAQYASSGPVSTAFAKLVAYHYAIPQGASMLKAADELFS